MNRCLISFSVLALLFLNGCCSSCHRFWENVERGDFYDETLQNKVESSIAASAPDRYKAVSRVILNRGGSEQSFTLITQVYRNQGKLVFAGMSDLGTVMFAATTDKGILTVKKNHSGWGDQVIHDVLEPMLKAVSLPELTEVAVVQSAVGGKLQHRSRRPDGRIENYIFDKDGARWVEYRLQSFSFFGEIEKVQRVRFSSFKPVNGWEGMYPYQIEVDDAIHGFRAKVSIQRVAVTGVD